MYLIGVFGKIGAGKSSFINLLKKYLDAEFLSADAENSALLSDDNYLSLLKSKFGDFFINGELDKKALKNKIFTDKIANQTLSSLAHPFIRSRLYSKIQNSNKRIVFVEISVFVDNFLDFDEKWLVTTSTNKQIKRLCNRDKIDETTARERIAFQYLPNENYFDRIIVNDNSFEILSCKTKGIADELKTALGIYE